MEVIEMYFFEECNVIVVSVTSFSPFESHEVFCGIKNIYTIDLLLIHLRQLSSSFILQ